MHIDTLVLKLVVTPILIAAASLAGRRWGGSVSGWLVGLPLTSGPVAFFLAVDHGESFAAAAAIGSLAGAIAEAAFCIVYGWAVFRSSWVVALVWACLAFALVAFALQLLPLPLLPVALGSFAILALTRHFMPRGSEPTGDGRLPRWDIPARMVITTVLVVLLTEAAPLLGARLSGVLATFPLYAAIMTVFAHRLQGAGAAVRVLRGLVVGLFAFCGFFVVLSAAIERIGVGPAFVAATVATVAIQGGSLRLMLASRARV